MTTVVRTMTKERRDELFNHVYNVWGGPAEYVNQILDRMEVCACEDCVYCGMRDCPLNEPMHFSSDGCPAALTTNTVA